MGAERPTADLWSKNRWWELCPDLLGLIDRNGYFVCANPAWQPILGWLPEEISRLPFSEFIHPDDLPKTQAEWVKVLAGDPVIRFENRYLCQNGTYKTLHWFAVLDGDHVFCQARDVDAEIAHWTHHERAKGA